jgi:hypothetical protein
MKARRSLHDVIGNWSTGVFIGLLCLIALFVILVRRLAAWGYRLLRRAAAPSHPSVPGMLDEDCVHPHARR